MQLALAPSYTDLPASQKTVDLLISLRAPTLPDDLRRTPLRIVAVLDRSGSMSGAKLDNLKATMIKLVDNLTDQDQLAMVWFESSVDELVPFTPMTSANKTSLKSLIASKQSGGGTQMADGLKVAADLLATLKDDPKTVTRGMLLTDGQQGGSLADVLEQVGRFPQFAALSCFGYGADWQESTISAATDKGNGNYYFVEDPKTIGRHFATELGGLLTCYGRDIAVSLQLADGITFDHLLNDYDAKVDGNTVTFTAGDIYFEEDRRIVCRLNVPDTHKNGDLASVKVDFLNLGEGKSFAVDAQVTVSRSKDGGEINKTVQSEAAVLEAAIVQAAAKKCADAGDWQQARQMMTEQVNYLSTVGDEYTTAFADVLSENLGGISADYTCDSASAKSMSSSSAFAKSKRGVTGSSVAAGKLSRMVATRAVKKAVDDATKTPTKEATKPWQSLG